MPGLEWRGTPAGTGIGTGLKYTSVYPRFSGVLQAQAPKARPYGSSHTSLSLAVLFPLQQICILPPTGSSCG